MKRKYLSLKQSTATRTGIAGYEGNKKTRAPLPEKLPLCREPFDTAELRRSPILLFVQDEYLSVFL